MKNKRWIIAVAVIVIAVAAVAGTAFMLNRGKETQGNTWDVTVAPTAEPTEPVFAVTTTPELTATPVPTATTAPTTAPTAEPAKEPEAAPTAEPAEEPVVTEAPEAKETPVPEVTEIPVPTETPEPTATSTPVPTATSTPTPSPVPTVAPQGTPTPTTDPEPDLRARFKAGDDAWYEVYTGGKLVITGTGSTYDYKDYREVYTYFDKMCLDKSTGKYIVIKSVFIEEGIVKLGSWSCSMLISVQKVYLPSTLIEIGEGVFYRTGKVDAEWIGIDTERMKIEKSAFAEAGGGLPNFNKEVVATPTPTPVPTKAPTPTPTPLPKPDPEKPRLLCSIKAGKNAYIESWDNGYVYVKGTGALYDLGLNDCCDALEAELGVRVLRKLVDVTHLIVEEGITRLGENSVSAYSSYSKVFTIELPSTLKSCANVFDTVNGEQVVIVTGYKDGKKVTMEFKGKDTFYDPKIREMLGISYE